MKTRKALRNALWNESYSGQMEGKCTYCKGTVDNNNFHVGHVISKKNGGSMDMDNLVILCMSCNTSMGSKDFNTYCKETKITPLISKKGKSDDDILSGILEKISKKEPAIIKDQHFKPSIGDVLSDDKVKEIMGGECTENDFRYIGRFLYTYKNYQLRDFKLSTLKWLCEYHNVSNDGTQDDMIKRLSNY